MRLKSQLHVPSARLYKLRYCMKMQSPSECYISSIIKKLLLGLTEGVKHLNIDTHVKSKKKEYGHDDLV